MNVCRQAADIDTQLANKVNEGVARNNQRCGSLCGIGTRVGAAMLAEQQALHSDSMRGNLAGTMYRLQH